MSGNKTVLILGGCGYVGGHLASTLIMEHYNVVIYDLAIPEKKFCREDVVYIKGNILNKDLLMQVTAEYKPFLAIHLSSYGMSGAAMLSPDCDVINIQGVEHTIEACLQHNVQCLVYTSTYNTCFAGQEIVNQDETLPTASLFDHTDCYGPSKTIAEDCVERAHLAMHSGHNSLPDGRLHTYVLRPAAIYGEDEARHFPRIMQHMDSGIFSLFRISAAVRVDWVHVDNLVQAYLGMLRRHKEVYGRGAAEDKASSTSVGGGYAVFPNTYFISDGSPIDSWDFLRPLAEARDCPFPAVVIPLPVMLCVAFMAEIVYRVVGVPPFLTRAEVYKVGVTHFFCIDKARRELEYQPSIATPEGAQRVADRHRLVPYTGSSKTTNNNVNAIFFRFAPWYWWLACVGGMSLVLYLAYFDAGMNAPITTVEEVVAAVTAVDTGSPSLLWASLYSVFNLGFECFLNQTRLLAYALFGSRVGIQWVWTLAAYTHVLEAVFGVLVADGIGVSSSMLFPWFIQTVLLGGPSLSVILDRMYKGYHHWEPRDSRPRVA